MSVPPAYIVREVVPPPGAGGLDGTFFVTSDGHPVMWTNGRRGNATTDLLLLEPAIK